MPFASRLSTILARILGRGRNIGPSNVTRQTSTVNVLGVKGKLVRGEACDAVTEQVKQLLSRGEKEGIVLNLENVTIIDQTGLATLVKAYTGARDRGVDLKLVCPVGEVLQVLQIAKLATVFQVFATEAEALASFK